MNRSVDQHRNASLNTTALDVHTKECYAWALLFVFVISIAFLYSIIQPLGHAPDEYAHVQYIKFIEAHRRLPVWQPDGGGEAGYESQHPPLYYILNAVLYHFCISLPENWRWQIMRWFSILLGGMLFFAVRGFALDLFKKRIVPALVLTSAFMLMPLTLEYSSHINVDILSVTLSAVVLWMSLRVARGEGKQKDRIVLGIALGVGFLTKLTVLGLLPMVITAYILDSNIDCECKWVQRRMRFMSTLLITGILCGWWYARNSWMYGTPFIHTVGQLSSGINLAAITGEGARLLFITLRNTYISSWIEMAWMPPGALGVALYSMLTVMLFIAAGMAIRNRFTLVSFTGAFDPALWLCGILLLTLFLSHQTQVWFTDYEFNAGGRYLLNGMVAAHALVISALYKTRRHRIYWFIWIALFVIMNAFAIHHILTVLTPKCFPDWHPFHFP